MASLFAWETIHSSFRPKKSQVLARAMNYYLWWLPKLLGYDYQIECKKGPENQGADSLSHVVEFQFLYIHFNATCRLVDSTKRSPTKFLLWGLDQNTITPPIDPAWWSVVQKWISLLKPYLNFDSKCDYRLSLKTTGGHFEFHKTLSCIKKNFFWSNMHRSMKEFLQ